MHAGAEQRIRPRGARASANIIRALLLVLGILIVVYLGYRWGLSSSSTQATIAASASMHHQEIYLRKKADECTSRYDALIAAHQESPLSPSSANLLDARQKASLSALRKQLQAEKKQNSDANQQSMALAKETEECRAETAVEQQRAEGASKREVERLQAAIDQAEQQHRAMQDATRGASRVLLLELLHQRKSRNYQLRSLLKMPPPEDEEAAGTSGGGGREQRPTSAETKYERSLIAKWNVSETADGFPDDVKTVPVRLWTSRQKFVPPVQQRGRKVDAAVVLEDTIRAVIAHWEPFDFNTDNVSNSDIIFFLPDDFLQQRQPAQLESTPGNSKQLLRPSAFGRTGNGDSGLAIGVEAKTQLLRLTLSQVLRILVRMSYCSYKTNSSMFMVPHAFYRPFVASPHVGAEQQQHPSSVFELIDAPLVNFCKQCTHTVQSKEFRLLCDVGDLRKIADVRKANNEETVAAVTTSSGAAGNSSATVPAAVLSGTTATDEDINNNNNDDKQNINNDDGEKALDEKAKKKAQLVRNYKMHHERGRVSSGVATPSLLMSNSGTENYSILDSEDEGGGVGTATTLFDSPYGSADFWKVRSLVRFSPQVYSQVARIVNGDPPQAVNSDNKALFVDETSMQPPLDFYDLAASSSGDLSESRRRKQMRMREIHLMTSFRPSSLTLNTTLAVAFKRSNKWDQACRTRIAATTLPLKHYIWQVGQATRSDKKSNVDGTTAEVSPNDFVAQCSPSVSNLQAGIVSILQARDHLNTVLIAIDAADKDALIEELQDISFGGTAQILLVWPSSSTAAASAFSVAAASNTAQGKESVPTAADSTAAAASEFFGDAVEMQLLSMCDSLLLNRFAEYSQHLSELFLLRKRFNQEGISFF